MKTFRISLKVNVKCANYHTSSMTYLTHNIITFLSYQTSHKMVNNLACQSTRNKGSKITSFIICQMLDLYTREIPKLFQETTPCFGSKRTPKDNCILCSSLAQDTPVWPNDKSGWVLSSLCLKSIMLILLGALSQENV